MTLTLSEIIDNLKTVYDNELSKTEIKMYLEEANESLLKLIEVNK